jgi:hypothetical protein
MAFLSILTMLHLPARARLRLRLRMAIMLGLVAQPQDLRSTQETLAFQIAALDLKRAGRLVVSMVS